MIGWEQERARLLAKYTAPKRTCEHGPPYGHARICDTCDPHLRLCYACHEAHAAKEHGHTPAPAVCGGCKKDLGMHPPAFSKAGAPWCGDCPRWWFE